MIAILLDCCDTEVVYGVLTVDDVSVDDVKQKICEIKENFFCNGNYDWTIEDIFAQFPNEWTWNYKNSVNYLMI